ncbi:hypothetical protein BGLA2_1520020 [Burkholderia gladioli]|nr:hypothetical protein BGLA2_1520020 [Burkholderia gladioli]
MGHAASAQPGGLDQARLHAAQRRVGAVSDSLDAPREAIARRTASAPTGADFILRAAPGCRRAFRLNGDACYTGRAASHHGNTARWHCDPVSLE